MLSEAKTRDVLMKPASIPMSTGKTVHKLEARYVQATQFWEVVDRIVGDPIAILVVAVVHDRERIVKRQVLHLWPHLNLRVVCECRRRHAVVPAIAAAVFMTKAKSVAYFVQRAPTHPGSIAIDPDLHHTGSDAKGAGAAEATVKQLDADDLVRRA